MMLGVVGMLIYRSRDPALWRWMADDVADEKPVVRDSRSAHASPETETRSHFRETLISGPNDQQPFEQSEAERLFQAISDKTPVAAEEMPAYWRLLRWSLTQSFEDLQSRARADVVYTNFADIPHKLRGQPVYLRLSLRRVLQHDDVGPNSAGVKQLYEAWGVTSESRSWPYVLVFYDKPPELPVGAEVHEEAEFVGYFLKLMAYEDFAVTRWAPLLIGRMRWRENVARSALRRQSNGYDVWPWVIVALATAAFGIGWVWTRPSGTRSLVSASPAPTDHVEIERWLEAGAPDVAPVVPDSGDVLAGWDEMADGAGTSRPGSLPPEDTNSRVGDVAASDRA